MPFARENLSALQQDAWANIATRMPGSAPFQRGTVENVLGTVLAGFQNDQLGYTDWVAKEAVPWTADGEFQVGWGGLRDVTLNGPQRAQGNYTFSGNPGAPVYSASTVTINGQVYTVPVGGALGDTGALTCLVVAQAAGSVGNCAPGTPGSLVSPLSGVASTGVVASAGISGGTDLETSAHFGTRINQAWANPPQGGDLADYVTWAFDDVPAVTRAWSAGPALMGPGTVTVFFCIDDALHTNGLPIGSNGVSQYERRPGTVATGDQLTLANALFPEQSAAAMVFAAAPTGVALNVALQEVPDDATIRGAITAAIAGLLLREASPVGCQVVQTLADGTRAIVNGGTIDIDHLQAAIAAVPGLNDFVMTSPSADVVLTVPGQISIPGAISYTNPS